MSIIDNILTFSLNNLTATVKISYYNIFSPHIRMEIIQKNIPQGLIALWNLLALHKYTCVTTRIYVVFINVPYLSLKTYIGNIQVFILHRKCKICILSHLNFLCIFDIYIFYFLSNCLLKFSCFN